MAYKRFPAKVLLFGEHILLRGATALSLPVPRFGGHWAWISPEKAVPAQGLLANWPTAKCCARYGIQSRAFALELSRGIWFRSDMMSGYGLGSSGVVCAAIYDRYCREKATDLAELKSQLAHIESFFHGKSSGIDPLTAYLGQPIVVRNRTAIFCG